jgi:hypothetical protein
MAIRVISYKLGVIGCLKTFIIYNLSLIILSSCSYKKEVPPPPDLIEESKMAQVISDISITEAILTNEPLASMNDSIKKINVLKEHGLTSRQFLSSMKYYSENPLKLQSIYEEVEKIISSKQNPVDTTTAKK